MLNFDYLKNDVMLDQLYRYCDTSEQRQATEPEVSALNARRALDWIVKSVYEMKGERVGERASLFLSCRQLRRQCRRFIRTIVKVDRQKAVQLFTDYISENSLTAEQEEYLKSILDYVCENGDMETAALVNESPFDEINVLELFPGKFKQVADFVANLHKSITAA